MKLDDQWCTLPTHPSHHLSFTIYTTLPPSPLRNQSTSSSTAHTLPSASCLVPRHSPLCGTSWRGLAECITTTPSLLLPFSQGYPLQSSTGRISVPEKKKEKFSFYAILFYYHQIEIPEVMTLYIVLTIPGK